MRFVGVMVRIFSLGFHLLLTLFLLAVSALAWTSGQHNLQIGVLPWHGASLTHWVFFSGLAGFILTLLAIKRILPLLFFVWTLAVLIMLVRGFFFSGYTFGLGSMSLSGALYLVAAALVAAIGAWLQVRAPRGVAERRHALA